LTAPPCSEDRKGSADVYAGLAPTIQQLAVAWEILDRHEVAYVLARKEDFHSDMALLRQRFEDLHDAPPLHDSMRFPPRQVVSDLLTFNRTYREHVEKCQIAGASPSPDQQEVLNEVDRLYTIWDAIRDCRCEYYYITVRRQALKKVRELIGDDAFYNGNYPPHVPVWRFQRID
jgi:hypothetical protein